MKFSDNVRLYSLAFLGRTGIIDIKKMIIDGKLKLSPSMAYEFSLNGIGIIVLNQVKRTIELTPSKDKDIIYNGARDAGREAILLLKERLIGDDTTYNLEKALNLVMKCFGMKGSWIRKLSDKETVGRITECPFSKIIIKEKIPETCMVCEGLNQGVADTIEKGSKVEIPKKISKGDKYCEILVKREKPVKGPYLEAKLDLPLDFIHEFTLRELGRVLIKIGKKSKRVTSLRTWKEQVFWGARNAGMEIAETMKSLGIRDGLNAVEAGTILFSASSRMERAQIKVSEEENIGRVFRCPWSSIIIKEKLSDACVLCEGFCQGVADVLTENCTIKIPKKITKGDEYCEFIYRRTKIMS